jgi:hypothetical protein
VVLPHHVFAKGEPHGSIRFPESLWVWKISMEPGFAHPASWFQCPWCCGSPVDPVGCPTKGRPLREGLF